MDLSSGMTAVINPRPPAEGDDAGADAVTLIGPFQSTPSCGGRLRLSIATLQKLFQSDLRESPGGSCNFTTVKKPFEKYDINPPYYIYRGTHRENTRA